jgi:hypothetical protein
MLMERIMMWCSRIAACWYDVDAGMMWTQWMLMERIMM